MSKREAILAAARTWLGTPFALNQCVKGVAVDCGRVLAASLNEAGVKQIDLASLPILPPLWFLHQESHRYLDVIRHYATEYELRPGERPQMADIVVVKYGRDWAHAAFVTEWPALIACIHGFCVAEIRDLHLHPNFQHRPMKFFDPLR